MSWLKAFPHAGLMNEHSLGFSLKKAEPLLGEERMQALTALKWKCMLVLQLGWHHGKIPSSRPLFSDKQGSGGFFILE